MPFAGKSRVGAVAHKTIRNPSITTKQKALDKPAQRFLFYKSYKFRLLFAEGQLVIAHRIDDGEAGQLVAGGTQLGTARLEALFNADADTGD